MPIHAVIDLGFGDGGKGVAVDNIAFGCDTTPLVIRFSGGQQCGHAVMPDADTKHVFSSFGSGTFCGAPTFFTKDTTFYPSAIINEWCKMPHKTRNGVDSRSLMIHPLAMLTTPYDIAYNRMKEAVHTKHGSCGLGVGATSKRCIETPYKTFAQDLSYPALLEQKLERVKGYYLDLIRATSSDHDRYYEMLNAFKYYLGDGALEEIFLKDIYLRDTSLPFSVSDVDVNAYSNIIFEGSQGIMLDMDHGIFPNVTYANTTSKNAFRFCKERGLRITDIHYVTRCYTTRHGEGWMPNETPIELINTKEEINVKNDWQGGFRISEIDYDMLNYALGIDAAYHDSQYNVNKHLRVSCLDQRPDFILNKEKLQTEQFIQVLGGYSPMRGNMKRI